MRVNGSRWDLSAVRSPTGGGARDPSTSSWRALTTARLADLCARRRDGTRFLITEINAALSGTGSDLAAFRAPSELIPYSPDLVFVEFAVNDGAVPQGLQNTIRSHETIAGHYDLPSIDVGQSPYYYRERNRTAWEDLLPDGTHPSDQGHAVYADAVSGFLEDLLGTPAEESETQAEFRTTKLPAPFTEDPFTRARIVPVAGWQVAGWEPLTAHVGRRDPVGLRSCEPGAEIAWRFAGTAIGVCWLVTPESGDVIWQVDDGPVHTETAWDRYALEWPLRVNYRFLDDASLAGDHRIRLSIASTRQPESAGTCIGLIGFLLGERQLERNRDREPVRIAGAPTRCSTTFLRTSSRFVAHRRDHGIARRG